MLLLPSNLCDREPQPLILPGNPLFGATLGSVKPPTEQEGCDYVFRKDSMVMEAVGKRDLDEYLEGGEWDEVDNGYTSDILFLPYIEIG